jgi:hypothetical protein
MSRKFIQFAVFWLAIGISILTLLVARLPYEHPLALILNKKDILAKSAQTDAPKIVFVGGSSVFVGIDCIYIKNVLGYNPVNLGVHAGFKIPFLLYLVSIYVKRGDIIVLTPEYAALSHYSEISSENETFKWSLAAAPGFSLKNYYSFPERSSALFADVASLCQWKALCLLHCVLFGKYARLRDNGCVAYQNTINEYGDETKGNLVLPVPQSVLRNVDEKIKDTVDGGLISDWNAVAMNMQKRGVKICFIYPPFPRELVQIHRKFIDNFSTLMKTRGMIPVLGTPEDFAFEYECFTDSPNHLTQACREKRTKRIIELLKTFLETRRPENVLP